MKPSCIALSLFLFLSATCGRNAFAQDSAKYSPNNSSYNNSNSYKMKKAAQGLKESLSKDDEEQTAKQYEILSKEFERRGDFAKAEEYLKRALQIYIRLNKKPEIAGASRGLARVQESQNKIAPAIRNYQSAAEATEDKTVKFANTNDAKRLQNSNDLDQQKNYHADNAVMFEKEGDKDEAANSLRQLAKTQWKQNQPEEAAATLKKAIEVTEKPEDAANMQKEMVQMYVKGDHIDKAIEVSKDLLKKAKADKNEEEEVIQLRELANIYQKGKDSSKTEALLKESYELAIKTNNTIQAKNSVLALAQFYNSIKKDQQSLYYYNDFINRMDSIIKADSSLIDTKILEVTENRIHELEKERVLQNELMARKTRFNYVLIGSVLLMLSLLFLIGRALYAIRLKNKKIALQSLRREMNPHFIFNSLNSVNQYIAENNELQANKYLTSYSSLMRNIMENSNKDFVSLSIETDQLRKYLDLEHQRFHDKFDYTLIIDDELDPDAVMIPNMLIQPHLENAIWHGLRYKDTKGMLNLEFHKKNSGIEVIISDDGIGLAKSKALKTTNQKAHQSRGITNTEERISLLNDIYKTHIFLQIKEVNEAGATGTRVMIQMPLIAKK